MKNSAISLSDYANERANVVLFYAGNGTPSGSYHPLGHPDLDFAERNGLLDLTGTVDESGDWRWDGDGNPTDDSANIIYRIHAYVDAKRWTSDVEEY